MLSKKLATITLTSILFILIFAIILFADEPKQLETIKIYSNGVRGVIKGDNTIYYRYSETGEPKIVSSEAMEWAIKNGKTELILEAEIKQYGKDTENIHFMIGGYSPTAFAGIYGVTPLILGEPWNKNQFPDKSIKSIMNDKEGIAVIISYDTHWDYGGPGSNFNKSLEGAFKNLMSQTEYELRNIGMTENKTTITSYSTGHYLGMSYLTDPTRKEFGVVTYNAVAPNTRGSELEHIQFLSGGDAYDDIIKNSVYTTILNSNPYFRDNVNVNVYFTEQDFKQNTLSVIYYTDKKEKEAKLKDIADNYFWQVKGGNLKLYLPDATIHTDPQKIYAQLNNQTIPYYQQNETGNITYYNPNILLEVKKDQLTLQKNIKQQALVGILKNAPCGAKTGEITSLQGEINSIDQQIMELDGQLVETNSE